MYGCSAVTAVTAQNTVSVRRSVAVSADLVEAQMEMVLGDIRISAVKIGLLPTASVVRAVARVLARHETPDVVYDPVMAASTGRSLQAASALDAARGELLPRVTVVTPNLAELARLTGSPPPGADPEVDRAARRLLDAGPGWVLVTGGHRPGRSKPRPAARGRVDRGAQGGIVRLASRRGMATAPVAPFRLPSTARLALGDGVPEAVEAAKTYLGGALAAGARAGGGGRSPVP